VRGIGSTLDKLLSREPRNVTGLLAFVRDKHIPRLTRVSKPSVYSASVILAVGLTLTHANHVIHLSRWWNPAVEDQCTGRVVRIGQTRDVEVHIPISLLPKGNASFDQNLHALLERKRRLMRDALLPANATEADRNDLFQATIN
jgi:hypothetical protein